MHPRFFKTKSSGVVNQDGIALSCDSKDCYQLGWLNKACDGFGARKKDRSATQCSMISNACNLNTLYAVQRYCFLEFDVESS